MPDKQGLPTRSILWLALLDGVVDRIRLAFDSMITGLRPIIILFGSGELRFQRLEDELLLPKLPNSWDGDFAEVSGTALGLELFFPLSCSSWSIWSKRWNVPLNTFHWAQNKLTTLVPARSRIIIWVSICALICVAHKWVVWRMPTVQAWRLFDSLLSKEVLDTLHAWILVQFFSYFFTNESFQTVTISVAYIFILFSWAPEKLSHLGLTQSTWVNFLSSHSQISRERMYANVCFCKIKFQMTTREWQSYLEIFQVKEKFSRNTQRKRNCINCVTIKSLILIKYFCLIFQLPTTYSTNSANMNERTNEPTSEK